MMEADQSGQKAVDGLSRRSLLRSAAGATAPLLTAGTATRHRTSENVDGVEQLDEPELTKATVQALTDQRTRKLFIKFLDNGFRPRLRKIYGVTVEHPETSDREQVVIFPFTTGNEKEEAWLQHSTNPDAEPAPAAGFHTVHHNNPATRDPYYDVEIYRVNQNGDVEKAEDRVGNLFGCPNDKVNPKGVTQMAADYAVTFVSCAGCVGSSTVFAPVCALCLAQIARMSVSLEDYNWCECDPTKNC